MSMVNLLDRDAKTGLPIDQNPKTGRSSEIDGKGRFAGHRFLLKTKLYGDKRCLYCGQWFHWKDSDYHRWLKEDNIDRTNLDKVLEPFHCGSEHCTEFHYQVLNSKMQKAEEKAGELESKTWALYKQLKSSGVI